MIKRVDAEILTEPTYQRLLEQHGIKPADMLNLLERFPKLDPMLFAQVIDFARRSYHSLDMWGAKANYKRDMERIVEDYLEEQA